MGRGEFVACVWLKFVFILREKVSAFSLHYAKVERKQQVKYLIIKILLFVKLVCYSEGACEVTKQERKRT